jgi:hypothetical protein
VDGTTLLHACTRGVGFTYDLRFIVMCAFVTFSYTSSTTENAGFSAWNTEDVSAHPGLRLGLGLGFGFRLGLLVAATFQAGVQWLVYSVMVTVWFGFGSGSGFREVLAGFCSYRFLVRVRRRVMVTSQFPPQDSTPPPPNSFTVFADPTRVRDFDTLR